MPGVEHVAVCLLSEKLIIKGEKLISDEIIDMVDMLGFEATEIKEISIDQGNIQLKLSIDINSIDDKVLQKNGINKVEILTQNILKVNFTPEAISARQIAYFIEDKLFCKATYHQESSNKLSLVEQQQKFMRS